MYYVVAFGNNSFLLRMDLTPRRRAQDVALHKHTEKSVREFGLELRDTQIHGWHDC